MSRRKIDPRVARIREAVVSLLGDNDPLGCSSIIDSIVGWIECHGDWSPRSSSAVANAIAALAAALPDGGIAQVHAAAIEEQGINVGMHLEFAREAAEAAQGRDPNAGSN